VHPILDQGQCGCGPFPFLRLTHRRSSCWAFGAAESLSDRLCIATNGTVDVELSPQALVSCDWEGNFGCNGGIPQLAWMYMATEGLPTLDCQPYTSGALLALSAARSLRCSRCGRQRREGVVPRRLLQQVAHIR
jgi:cathepsin B